MNKFRTIGIVLAVVGLVLAILLLTGAFNFFRTMRLLTKDNPSVVAQRDTLRINTNSDTIAEFNTGLNQQIAEKLSTKQDTEKERKQKLLHQTIMDFISTIDSIQNASWTMEVKQLLLKNSVNKTNMGCRAALFNPGTADEITELNIFLIIDEKKLENTIFECFSKKEITINCYDAIKHQAYLLEKVILEKNFMQLKI